MKECRFLVPTSTPRRPLEESLVALGGGFQGPTLTRGAWRETREVTWGYVVALPEHAIPALRGILQAVKVAQGEEAIYLSVAGAVEFL